MSYRGNSIMWIGVAILSLVLSACSSTPTYPPAPKLPKAGTDWNYLIGPGDTVQVFVWRNPDVSGSFPVRPDGKMTMNLVEDLPAAGLTPTHLARNI
jgi:polysaccharide export outer membrane protein